MSLLNDALRKKRSEEPPPADSLKASLPKLGRRSSRMHKLRWTAIVCVLVISAATCGAWFYWTVSDASSDLSAVQAPSGISDIRPGVRGEKSAHEKSTTDLSKPVSVKPETVVAAPFQMKKPSVQEYKQLKNAKKVPTKAPATPPVPAKQKATPKARAALRREKKPVKIKPRKKSLPKPHPSAFGGKAKMVGAEQRDVQSERLYQKARQYHRQNRIDQAVALYREVIKIDPDHYKARFNLAAAYLQTGSYTHAYPIVADLYLNEPHNLPVMLNLAIAHIGCRRYSQALGLLDKAAHLPAAPLFEIAFHKAVAYSHLNQAETALIWYKRAEAIRPDDPRLLFNLAVISDQQQNYDAAVDYYHRHIEHSPDIDAVKEKQIRRRIRTLQAYHAEPGPKEFIRP